MTYRQTEQRAKGEARSERERLPRAEGEADAVADCRCDARLMTALYAIALLFSPLMTSNNRLVSAPSKTCSGTWGTTSVKGLS